MYKHTYAFRKGWRGIYIDFREARLSKNEREAAIGRAECQATRRRRRLVRATRAILRCTRACPRVSHRRRFQRSEIALPRSSSYPSRSFWGTNLCPEFLALLEHALLARAREHNVDSPVTNLARRSGPLLLEVRFVLLFVFCHSSRSLSRWSPRESHPIRFTA